MRNTALLVLGKNIGTYTKSLLDHTTGSRNLRYFEPFLTYPDEDLENANNDLGQYLKHQ